MKKLIASSFDEFMAGNGIWIVIGVLAGALIITTIFLILNILKEKKKKEAEKVENPSEQNITQEQVQTKNEEKIEEIEKVQKEAKASERDEKVEKTTAKSSSKKSTPAKKNKVEKASDEETKKPEKEQKVTYAVTYDKENREWVVKKSGSSRASKRCPTKEEALDVAEKLSKQNNALLRVHKKNGKFQKQ